MSSAPRASSRSRRRPGRRCPGRGGPGPDRLLVEPLEEQLRSATRRRRATCRRTRARSRPPTGPPSSARQNATSASWTSRGESMQTWTMPGPVPVGPGHRLGRVVVPAATTQKGRPPGERRVRQRSCSATRSAPSCWPRATVASTSSDSRSRWTPRRTVDLLEVDVRPARGRLEAAQLGMARPRLPRRPAQGRAQNVRGAGVLVGGDVDDGVQPGHRRHARRQAAHSWGLLFRRDCGRTADPRPKTCVFGRDRAISWHTSAPYDGRAALAGDDAAEDERHAEGLGPAEDLAREDDAEQGADDRVDQADQRDRAGGHPGQAAEPADVRQRRAGRGQPQQPADVGDGQRRRRAFDQQRDRDQREAAGDQLPGDRGEHVGGRRPALDQHEAEGGDEHDPIAPTRPRVDSSPPARSTSRATPRTPTRPATTRRTPGRSPSTGSAIAITASGERHWKVAARPPGSSYAARNSSGMNSPMLHSPSSAAFHHQSPWGSWRRKASRTSPAGRARAAAANSGRSGGRKRPRSRCTSCPRRSVRPR